MVTVHTYPVGDLVEHDTEGDECICGPTAEPVQRDDGSYGWHIIHHSLDNREFRERERAAAKERPVEQQCGEKNTKGDVCWRAKDHDGAHIADHGSNLTVTWPRSVNQEGRWL